MLYLRDERVVVLFLGFSQILFFDLFLLLCNHPLAGNKPFIIVRGLGSTEGTASVLFCLWFDPGRCESYRCWWHDVEEMLESLGDVAAHVTEGRTATGDRSVFGGLPHELTWTSHNMVISSKTECPKTTREMWHGCLFCLSHSLFRFEER